MSNPTRPSRGGAVAVGLLVGLAGGGCKGATDLGPPAARHACLRPLEIERVEDLGAFPLPSPTVIGRDGAESGEFHGRVVWMFGDTFVTEHNAIDGSSVLSATSGWSDPATPLALTEPVDDAGIPDQLIPYTAEEIAANRADALNGWALWPGAAVDTGGSQALVFFQRIKRTNGSGFDSVAVGTARLALNGTVAERNPEDLFAEPDGGSGTSTGRGRRRCSMAICSPTRARRRGSSTSAAGWGGRRWGGRTIAAPTSSSTGPAGRRRSPRRR